MSYISNEIRQLVAERASYRCEYCRVRAKDMFLGFEIDHIISLKHGGGSEYENLAFACPHCNVNKGSDLTTFLEHYSDIVPLFNPRLQEWPSHFDSLNGQIIGLTKIGEATLKLLKLNDPDRVIQRQFLQTAGFWPD